MSRLFDAVIVGSGATGSWVAKTLTESGLDVCLLDAGALFDHLRHRTSAQPFAERYPVQARLALCNPHTQHLFVDDIDNPYTTPAERPFDWFRSRVVGGRLRSWGRVCLRVSDHELEEPARDGHGIAWPVSHAELAPHYAEIERFLSVTGRRASLPGLPDGEFVDPVCEACDGYQRLAANVPAKLGYPVVPGRVALREGASVLAAALETGRLTLRPNAIVHRVITEPGGGRAKGVAFFDRYTMSSEEVFGKVVVLAASCIESTRLLLMSAPGGLGNDADVLGAKPHGPSAGERLRYAAGAAPLRPTTATWPGARAFRAIAT